VTPQVMNSKLVATSTTLRRKAHALQECIELTMVDKAEKVEKQVR